MLLWERKIRIKVKKISLVAQNLLTRDRTDKLWADLLTANIIQIIAYASEWIVM